MCRASWNDLNRHFGDGRPDPGGSHTEAMNLARRRGSTKFWLSTGGHNTTAQALYESLQGGRKPLGDVNYWWDLDRPLRLGRTFSVHASSTDSRSLRIPVRRAS